MVQKGPGRPNAKIGGCRVGLHMMSFLVALAAVGIASIAVRENARPAKHPCQYIVNCSAAEAVLAQHGCATHPCSFTIWSNCLVLEPCLWPRRPPQRPERESQDVARRRLSRRQKTFRQQGEQQARASRTSQLRRRPPRSARPEIGRRAPAAPGRRCVAQRRRCGRGRRRWPQQRPRRGRRRHACASGVYKSNFTTPPRRRRDVRSARRATSTPSTQRTLLTG
jgi:hypothetical protein